MPTIEVFAFGHEPAERDRSARRARAAQRHGLAVS
jgi:hypothetical protein